MSALAGGIVPCGSSLHADWMVGVVNGQHTAADHSAIVEVAHHNTHRSISAHTIRTASIRSRITATSCKLNPRRAGKLLHWGGCRMFPHKGAPLGSGRVRQVSGASCPDIAKARDLIDKELALRG